MTWMELGDHHRSAGTLDNARVCYDNGIADFNLVLQFDLSHPLAVNNTNDALEKRSGLTA